MKQENIKGQKLIEPIYFCFLENACFLGKCPKFFSKQSFFTFAKKLIHSCFFFTQKSFLKEFFVILQKPHAWKKSGSKKLPANQIAVFFDHQCLWKEPSDILVIFHRVDLQEMAASEKVILWSDVARFAFHAIRLRDSLIIKILRENQLIS